MRSFPFAGRVLCLLPALSPALAPAAESDPVGEALVVVESASAAGQVGERVLAAGSVIHLGDLVSTDGSGEVQLLFRDDTKMVVGANSSLVIDRFLFRSDSAENNLAVRALGGAFRFIGGRKGEGDYRIRTPTATIGVRGTAFDFTVSPVTTDLMLLEGVAALCGTDGGCALMAETCGIVRAPSNRPAHAMLNERERARLAKTSFPFLTGEDRLLDGFRLEAEQCTQGRSAARAIRGDEPVEVEAVAAIMERQEIPEPPAAEPPAPEPPEPPAAEPPEPPEPAEPPAKGNPGNDKAVGNAGPSPNGRDFGAVGQGRSNVGGGPGTPNGQAYGQANGHANGHANGRAQGDDAAAAEAGGGGGGNQGRGQGRGRDG